MTSNIISLSFKQAWLYVLLKINVFENFMKFMG